MCIYIYNNIYTYTHITLQCAALPCLSLHSILYSHLITLHTCMLIHTYFHTCNMTWYEMNDMIWRDVKWGDMMWYMVYIMRQMIYNIWCTTYKKITYGTWYTIFDVWCVSYDVCYIYNMMWYDVTSQHKCILYLWLPQCRCECKTQQSWVPISPRKKLDIIEYLPPLAVEGEAAGSWPAEPSSSPRPWCFCWLSRKLGPHSPQIAPTYVILPEYELRKWALHNCFEADLAAQATWLFQCQTACQCHGFGVWCKLRIYFKPWQSFGQQNVKMAFVGAEPRRSWIFAHAFDGGICTDWNFVENLSAFRGAQASATSWQRRCPAARRRAGMAEEVADSELLLP